MNRALTPKAAALALWLLVPAAPPLLALERTSYSLEVLVEGVPIEEYAARGTTYVEALAGREYSIRLTNHTPRRIAVALAVDGLNTIDAKTTTSGDASKWILAPYDSITLDGWQTGSATARRFFFTTEEQSYGAWLGKTSNLGIISAAVFREKISEPAPIYRPQAKRSPTSGGQRMDAAESPAPSAPQARESAPYPMPQPLAEDDLAATGIGREVDHRVRRVAFDTEANPSAVLELRYEYRDALVRLGVLERTWARAEDPLWRRERARGFEDCGFAPDPYAPSPRCPR